MYLKGKDIKVPFDCLWYYMTRKFEVTTKMGDDLEIYYNMHEAKPKEFDKW